MGIVDYQISVMARANQLQENFFKLVYLSQKLGLCFPYFQSTPIKNLAGKRIKKTIAVWEIKRCLDLVT